MKRGFMFSLIGVLLSAFFILLFWLANTPDLDAEGRGASTRVVVLDQVVRAWESYVEDAAVYASRAAFINITYRWAQSAPSACDDLWIYKNCGDSVFIELFLGTTDGLCKPIASTPSLPPLLDAFVQKAADQLGVNITYNVTGRNNMSDYAPFYMLVEFEMNYSVSNGRDAAWNLTKWFQVIVPIEGLPDPLFVLYADKPNVQISPDERRITRNPVPRELLNKTTLAEMISNRTYVANPGQSPSYHQRLAKISCLYSEHGIESLVIPAEVFGAGGAKENASFTDHQVVAHWFYGREVYECGNTTMKIQGFGIPDFRMDLPHLARYGFNETSDYDDSCP